MSQNSYIEDDAIDISELFASLWSHKILITLFTGLSIFLAGYYALTTEKKFKAGATFSIEKKDGGGGFNISGELSALASLAGFSSGDVSSSIDALLERATKREFIIDMNEKFSIEHDPYFNSYDPDADDKDPFWKATIKQIIGWQKTNFEKKAIIEKNVINSFRDNVEFEQTDGGAISISVTHADPQKASDYANNFMEEIRRLVKDESTSAQDLRLNYLSETLADALQEMEEAQKNLKNYALKNSAMAQENFISDSLKLDQIRMEKRKVLEITNLLSIIEDLLKSGNLDGESYEALRLSHPLIDDIEFRRILGMSETISAWVWPEIEAIIAVSITLLDRIKRLDIDIKNIEENAQIYATSAEDLAKFTRDAKIAEATYKVLIEQVKSQSLAAGFEPKTFKVFEYATPPLAPSSPKRNLILILGAVLGLIIGCALSLMNAVRRGVFYTKSALIANARTDLALKSKSIKRLSRKSFSQIIPLISKKRIVELDEAAVKLANKKIIFVMNSGGQPSSPNTARLLAVNSAQSGRNIVLCDTTGQLEKEIKDKPTQNNSHVPTISIGENITIMSGADEASFFTSKNFNSTIKDLTDRFDQVFLCSSNRNAFTGLMALSEFSLGLVMVAGLRKTKKSDIKIIKSSQPINVLFYD
ncbi:MAG: GumC family protein [Paracoccaceae bacterium]